MSARLTVVMAGVLVALAVAVPSSAQGKSGGNKPGKGPTQPPSSGTVSVQPTSSAGIDPVVATTTPFAWLDDATVMEPGGVWIGVSMARWQGSGLSQTSFPVVDTAIGVAPRVQVGASVPRVAGSLGTMFFSAKVAMFSSDERAVKVAVGPTFEVLPYSPLPGQGRVEWGLPVSAQFDRGSSRIYGSTGYFSPGTWFAGAGMGRSLNDRIAISASFSHAWTTPSEPVGVATTVVRRRNELTGGGSYNLKPNVAVFGSISRTLGVAAEEGAGTTLSFGLSLTAAAGAFTR
jgi:hypothetical protein